MLSGQKIERVLVVTHEKDVLQTVFTHNEFASFEFIWADSFSRALFVQQSHPCHVLLVDESALLAEGPDGVLWFLQQQQSPIILLGDFPESTVSRAYLAGVRLWLPRTHSLKHPLVLLGALRAGSQLNEMVSAGSQQRRALSECHRQVDRLVSLLWRTGHQQIEHRWYNYRHMLERLEEEVNRAQRYRAPLTIALGEFGAEELVANSDHEIMTATAERISPHRRRSDVVGQYGLKGFMIVMSHTQGEGGVRCCQRLKSQLESSKAKTNGPIEVYFGVSTLSEEQPSPQSILCRAEEHLQSAKQGLNDGIVFA